MIVIPITRYLGLRGEPIAAAMRVPAELPQIEQLKRSLVRIGGSAELRQAASLQANLSRLPCQVSIQDLLRVFRQFQPRGLVTVDLGCPIGESDRKSECVTVGEAELQGEPAAAMCQDGPVDDLTLVWWRGSGIPPMAA